MSESRDKFISQLAQQLPPHSRPINILAQVAGWLVLSWLLAGLPLFITGEFRPNVEQQLTGNMRFLFETVSGFAAIMLVAVVALRSSIPAGVGRPLLLAAIVLPAVWLLNYVVGLFVPTMEASMLGKREHCMLEVLIFSLPPLVFGLYLVNRSYVLNWTATGFGLGLAAGFIPAWLMQLACMYDAEHGLLMHIGPAVAVALLGALLGWLWQWRKR